jgi:hypothetical protein
MSDNRQDKNIGELTTAEIKNAIEASDYLVEVGLLRELEAAKVRSVLGSLWTLAPGEVAEVNILGTILGKRISVGEQRSMRTTLSMLMQVRRPRNNAALIGIARRTPDADSKRFRRLTLSGSILDEDLHISTEGTEILSSFAECLRADPKTS